MIFCSFPFFFTNFFALKYKCRKKPLSDLFSDYEMEKIAHFYNFVNSEDSLETQVEPSSISVLFPKRRPIESPTREV